MKCPRCGEAAHQLDQAPGTYGSTRRRYICGQQHHFTTLEAYEPQASSIERTGLMKALRAIQARFSMRVA